jgi:hypothetical protein
VVEPIPVVGDDAVVGTTFVSRAAQQDEDDAAASSSEAVFVAGVVSAKVNLEEGTDASTVRSVTLELSEAAIADAEAAKGTAPVSGQPAPAETDADDPLPPPDNFPTAGLPAPKGKAKADEPADPEEPTK